MELNLKLCRNEGKSFEDAIFFRQLFGSFVYLTTTARHCFFSMSYVSIYGSCHLRLILDIAFSIGVVSQFMDQPQETHLIAAKMILCYIKGTLNYGLMYEKLKSFFFSGFVDVH